MGSLFMLFTSSLLALFVNIRFALVWMYGAQSLCCVLLNKVTVVEQYIK